MSGQHGVRGWRGGRAASPQTIEAAERWFVRHGLPYFVDSEREEAAAA